MKLIEGEEKAQLLKDISAGKYLILNRSKWVPLVGHTIDSIDRNFDLKKEGDRLYLYDFWRTIAFEIKLNTTLVFKDKLNKLIND